MEPAPASPPEILLRQAAPATAPAKSAAVPKSAAPGSKTVVLQVPYCTQPYGACWAAGAIMMVRAYGGGLRIENLLCTLRDSVDYADAGDGMYGLSHVDERWKALASEMSRVTSQMFIHEFFQGHSGSLLTKLTGLLDQGKPVLVAMAKHMILVIGYRLEKAADGTEKYWLILHDSRGMCPAGRDEGNMYWEVAWDWFRNRDDPNYSVRFGHRGQLLYPSNTIPRTAALQMMDVPSAGDLHANDEAGFRVVPFHSDKFSVMVLPRNEGGLGWEKPRAKAKADTSGQRPPVVIPAEADELVLKLAMWNADLEHAVPELRMEVTVVDAGDQSRITNLTESVELPPGKEMQAQGPMYFEEALVVSGWRREGSRRSCTVQASLLNAANSCLDYFQCALELAPLPEITGFAPERAAPGTGLTIQGDDFGTNGFKIGTVRIGLTPMEIVSWTDREIQVIMPAVTTPREVVVGVGRCESKGMICTPGPAVQKILVGDIAEVSLASSDDGAGTARWVVVGDDRVVEYKDIPDLRNEPYDRHSPIAGYMGKYRCDVATVEESFTGPQVVARIQFTDLGMTNLTGTHRLMRICLPPEPKDFETAQQVETAVMDRVLAQWSPEDAGNWVEMQELFRARVKQMKVEDWLATELEWNHGFSIYRDLGFDIQPLAMDTRHRMMVVDVLPCKLAITVPTGWRMTGTNGTWDRFIARELDRDWEGEKADETQILSSGASMFFELMADTNLPALFRKDHAGVEGWSGATVRYGEYDGTAYTQEKEEKEHGADLNQKITTPQVEDEVTKKVRIDFLLQKGKLFLSGHFGYSVSALNLVGFQNERFDEAGAFLGSDKEVMGDGRPRMDKLAGAIRSEIEGMLNSIRLAPRGEPAKRALLPASS